MNVNKGLVATIGIAALVLVDVACGQPVPMARPIFSSEELCPCLVPFPAELNLRLGMSTQVKYP